METENGSGDVEKVSFEEVLSRLERLYEEKQGKMRALTKALERTRSAEEYLKKGQALQANLKTIRKGETEVELETPEGERISVELDPSKTPVENMERFFRLYKKMKSGEKRVKEQIEQTQQVIEQIVNLLEKVRRGESLPEAEEFLLKFSKKKRLKGNRFMPKKLRRIISSDGFEIFVGRNQRENDYLSLKFAHKDDLFLHAGGYSGSHIIIRTNGKPVPEQTVNEAATLAVYYSKARKRNSANVSLTRCANVYKPKNAKPGLVHIRDFKTINISIKKDVLVKLLSQLSEAKQ